jgi:signal transduction histidine kinase
MYPPPISDQSPIGTRRDVKATIGHNVVMGLLGELSDDERHHLADAFEASSPEICRKHTIALREAIGATAGLSDDGVLDDLATCLDAMVRILRPEKEGSQKVKRVSPGEELRLAGTAHAVARYGQSFTTGELLIGGAVLRHNVNAILRETLGRRLNATEADLVHALLDELAASSAVSFADLREQRAHLEAEAMSRFLASLAHDVRGSLNAAMMSMHLITSALSSGDLTPEQASELACDADESRRLIDGALHTMTAVLQAEQLRAGAAAVQVRRRAVELAPLLAAVARAVARTANANMAVTACGDADDDRAQVCVDCDPEVVIQTDPDLLMSILLNYVRNAVRYAGSRGPIELRHERTNDGWTRISVSDNGPGLSKEQQATIFDRFHRGAASHSSGGLGLGLFIARCAADLLEAEVWVDSEEGEGATFGISLPPVAAD